MTILKKAKNSIPEHTNKLSNEDNADISNIRYAIRVLLRAVELGQFKNICGPPFNLILAPIDCVNSLNYMYSHDVVAVSVTEDVSIRPLSKALEERFTVDLQELENLKKSNTELVEKISELSKRLGKE